jgi:hypothetical protein
MADAAKLNSKGNLITPRGPCLYPALFTPQLPRGETDESRAKFQCSILIPAAADLTALHKEIQRVLDEKMPKAMQAKTKLRMPILETSDQPRLLDYADDYPWLIRGNASKRVDVVTVNGMATVPEEDEADLIYSGRWVRLSLRPFFWDHPTGGKGVSLGLQNVMLALDPQGEPGEPIASGRVRGVSDFAEVAEALEDLE